MRMPVVAIVGKPNVGKSSLLNTLARKRISIVQDMPGVTRDRISTPLKLGHRFVEIVDTGGYGFEDAQGLSEHIAEQIHLAMSRANLAVLVVDSQQPMTNVDQEVATLLREKNIKTVLVANKADNESTEQGLSEYSRLGLGSPLPVSANTGRNIEAMLDLIGNNVDLSDAPESVPEPEMMLAIVGKRNAGKSTLVNAIAEIYEGDPQRVIVSEVAGTTRDSIDVRFEKDGKALTVIDTAGVRKKRHMVNDDIEYYSFHRAQRSIRRADVVLFLLDSIETISEPDKKLAAYIVEQHKPVILVMNKWDLALSRAREQVAGDVAIDDTKFMEQFRVYVDGELPMLAFAPLAFITAKEQRRVQSLLDLSKNLYKQANERVTTHKLNEAMQQIMAERMPSGSGKRRPKVKYVTQVESSPPTIAMFVNDPQWFDPSFQRFVVHKMRELLPYSQVPIKLLIRGRGEGPLKVQAELPKGNLQAANEGLRPQKRRTGENAGRATKVKKSVARAKVSASTPPVKGGKKVSFKASKRTKKA